MENKTKVIILGGAVLLAGGFYYFKSKELKRTVDNAKAAVTAAKIMYQKNATGCSSCQAKAANGMVKNDGTMPQTY